MPVQEVQTLVNAIDNNKTAFNFLPIISKRLRELTNIPEPADTKQQIDGLKKQK